MSAASELAVNGGQPIRATPLPNRSLIGPEEKAAAMKLFDDAISSGQAFGYNGPCEQQYETDFAAFMGGGFTDGVNSGTTALYCALGALQLDALSEVIVPAITDPGGAMPVALLGCVPVVADTDPRSYNTNAEEIARMLSPRTRAIVVAHIAGDPVDMAPVLELAARHQLYVVEDCAQAHGAKYNGSLVGTLGHIAAFSTMFGKHHCTGGQGGVVFTRDEKLYWQAKRFADRGKPFNVPNATGNVVAGLNCNLNELSAAIGAVQLKKLPDIVLRRNRIGESIKQSLRALRAVEVGWQAPNTWSAYWFMKIRFKPEAVRVDKTVFCNALTAEGIPVGTSYRCSPGEAPWFKDKAVFGRSGFPWNCSDYAGPREPQARLANMVMVTDAHFNLSIHENYGPQEIADIVAAFTKVETVFAR